MSEFPKDAKRHAAQYIIREAYILGFGVHRCDVGCDAGCRGSGGRAPALRLFGLAGRQLSKRAVGLGLRSIG